jgi:ankyrin repeat protein
MAQQQDSNASEKELLFNAIRNGNTEDVERIIYKYPTLVNCQNASGFSPLAMAIREGDLIIADLLIDYGADLNFKHNGVDSCGLFALAREHNASADMCNLLQNKLEDYTKPALRNDASSDKEDDLEAPEPEVSALMLIGIADEDVSHL